jgi:hypothetical protein
MAGATGKVECGLPPQKGFAVAARKKKLSEEKALEIAIRDHPEWRCEWEKGTLPEEIVGKDGQPMSPRLHLSMHAIVECQLAADEPKGVVAIARQLEQLGLSRHDIRHDIGRAASRQMWYMMKEGCVFDEGRYLAELRKIVESHRGPDDDDDLP